jgi:hypothetical protein
MQVSDEGNTIYEFVLRTDRRRSVFIEETKSLIRVLDPQVSDDVETVNGYEDSIRYFATVELKTGSRCLRQTS